MTKRVALARALALDPEIVFLDEPTSGLDPIAAGDFDALIGTLQATLGLTVFMVTHDLESLRTVCDRIAALADGKVIAIGTMEAMLASQHPWMKAYFQGKRGRIWIEAAAPATTPADRNLSHGNPSTLRPDGRLHAGRDRGGLRLRLLARTTPAACASARSTASTSRARCRGCCRDRPSCSTASAWAR